MRVSSTGRGSLRTPTGFEAIGEALASGRDPTPALEAAGARTARLGVSLGEALEDLRSTTWAVRGADPTYAESTAVATAWSDEALGFAHSVSCEDPLTGLSSRAHLRASLAERYRRSPPEPGAPSRVGESLALVIVDSRYSLESVPPPGLGRAMWLGQVANRVRTVFTSDPVGRIAADRLAVLTQRERALGRRVALLRTLLDDLAADGLPARVWIEALPPTESGVDRLLDELSRASTAGADDRDRPPPLA